MKKHKEVAEDIWSAPNKSGLRQVDCAHLLGVGNDRISNIETGRARPTVLEVALLSIVFGKPMESLLSGLIDEVVDDLIERLRTMPSAPRNQLETSNRPTTLATFPEAVGK